MCAILCRVYLACNSTLPATQPYAAIKVTFDSPLADTVPEEIYLNWLEMLHSQLCWLVLS